MDATDAPFCSELRRQNSSLGEAFSCFLEGNLGFHSAQLQGNVERLVSTPGLLLKKETKGGNGFQRAPSRNAALELGSADGGHGPDRCVGGGQQQEPGTGRESGTASAWKSPSKSQCGAQTCSGSEGSAPWPATDTLRAGSADNLTKTSLSARPVLSFTVSRLVERSTRMCSQDWLARRFNILNVLCLLDLLSILSRPREHLLIKSQYDVELLKFCLQSLYCFKEST